ncbi:MAG TPA: BACON domain-containing protein, partial [Bacteroidales bacterium]|nr:BACON domain-containing protein [Bacteroidales bacterium]
TTYSDFTLNGTLDLEYGGCFVDGHFEIAPTGELIIGESLMSVENSNPMGNYIYGNLTMTDGEFHIDGNINLAATATTSITGGGISAVGFYAPFTGTFEPTAGIVEIQTTNNSFGPVECSNGNFFHDLQINYGGTSGGAYLLTDILVKNDLFIVKGNLWMKGYTATVLNNTLVDDGLIDLDDPGSVLNTGTSEANTIAWTTNAGLSDEGRINIYGNCVFERSGYFPFITNVLAFVGTGNQTFEAYGVSYFGTIELAKPSGQLIIPGGAQVFCQNYNYISGTLTINNGNFKALDLENEYTGGVINMTGGVLDFTQDATQEFHLSGEINMSGYAFFEIHSGSGVCKVADDYPLTLNMSDNATIVLIDADLEILANETLTLNLSGGSVEVYEGNFYNENAGFTCNGGTFELYGSDNTIHNTAGYFHDLLIEGIYTCPTDLLINGNFYPNNLFTFEGNELTCMGDVELYYGELLLTEGSTLRLNNNSSLSVGFFSYFNSTGTAGEMNLVTGVNPGDRYNFTVESNAAIIASYTIFENMSANGIYMSEGSGFLDQGFYGCTFRNGAEGGTLLTLNSTYSDVIIGAVFENNSDGAAFNVTKTNDQGEVTFTDYSGNFAGQPFENDPYNRIHWFTPGLTVTPLVKDVSATSGTTNFNVISNVDWTVSETAEWLWVDPLSSTGNGWITATFDENTSTSARSATITVSSEGLSDV